jgi:DNA polymerase (family X)
MPGEKKSSTKKKSARTSISRPGVSYVITKAKKPETFAPSVTLGVPTYYHAPDHPKSHGLSSAIKKNIDAAVLSAQAQASVFKDDLAERIPRAEVAEHVKFITTVARTTVAAGSFRRGAETCNDIDIIVQEPIENVIAQLSAVDYIKHTFSAGQHKFSGIVKHPMFPRHRHLDIVMTNKQSYPFALLYFTGSAKHNIILRLKAKKLGLRLNEYGLFRGDKPIPGITTEHDIFKALGVEYKEPNERI